MNKYLDSKYAKLLQCYEELLNEDRVITAQVVKARFLGSADTTLLLLELYALSFDVALHLWIWIEERFYK